MLFPPWNALFLELKCQQIAKRFIILPVRAKIKFSELDLRYMPYFRLNSRKFVNINHFLHLAQEQKAKVFLFWLKSVPLPKKTSCWRPWFSLERQKYEANQNVDQVTHSVLLLRSIVIECVVQLTSHVHCHIHNPTCVWRHLRHWNVSQRHYVNRERERERPDVTHISGEIPETQADWLNRRHRL